MSNQAAIEGKFLARGCIGTQPYDQVVHIIICQVRQLGSIIIYTSSKSTHMHCMQDYANGYNCTRIFLNILFQAYYIALLVNN